MFVLATNAASVEVELFQWTIYLADDLEKSVLRDWPILLADHSRLNT